jgi:L-amino acid ligase C-terminal domain 2
VTGVPLNDLAIDAALGEPVVIPPAKQSPPAAVTRFLVPPRGVLRSVDVPGELEGIARVRIYREPGHRFTALRRGADRAGAVLALGSSREQALARADAAAERIRFITADDGDLR